MNDTTTVDSPFGASRVATVPSGSPVAAQADQQRAVAEVQAAMMIARLNPRDPVAAMDRILNACTRPTLADAAIYQYSRGGSDVSGPSIRLAEAMAQQWGNFQFGIRELEQRNGESTVQAFAWDVETNTRREVTFQVPHVRHTRQGQKRLEDPRDIYEMVANQGARRLRACILGVIPGDVTEAAVNQCDATMRADVDITPDLIRTLLERFGEYGVTKEHIEARIQRHIESILPAQVVQLRKTYNSLKDGMSQPSDWFDIAPPTPAVDPAVAGLNEQIQKQPPAQAKASTTATTTTRKTDAGAPKVTLAKFRDDLKAATDLEAVDTLATLIAALPDDQQAEAKADYKARRAELAG